MAEKESRLDKYLENLPGSNIIEGIKDFIWGDPDAPSYTKITESVKELGKKDDAEIKDYYNILHEINKYQKDPEAGPPDFGGMSEMLRHHVLDIMDQKFPERLKEYNFRAFEQAYAEKDPKKKDRMLKQLRTQFDPSLKSPHLESGRPFVESDVTMAIKKGREKLPEPGYEGPFGKLGEYFSKNAAARDKLFSMMGSMGRELVKPIQPGQEAAGALVPTLSRGLGKGQEEYAAKQAAAAKTALDMATAQQKINPLQYYTTKMTEARLAVPQGMDPDSAEGKRWIGKYLMSVGIPGQVVDLTSSLESLNLQLLSAPNDEEKKRLQGLVDQINRQLQDVISQSIGGSSVTSVIDYSTLTGL